MNFLRNLNSFLRFGYFLDYKNPDYTIRFPPKNSDKYSGMPESEIVKIGVGKLKKAIEKKYKTGRHQVIPLSGGLDSRALLAGVMEMTDAKNIITFTFGTPGSTDFEIGGKISRIAGVRHYEFDLTKYKFSFDELLETSRRIDHQALLFHHFPLWGTDQICNGNIVWSGAIIDVYFGRHYHVRKGMELNEAKQNFINENYFVKSVNLGNISNEDLFPLIEYDSEASEEILYEHVLDLKNRQLKYIAPHVMPRGYEYAVLFDDEDLTGFSFNVNKNYIERQYLYKKIMLEAYPDYFKYEVKSNFGLPLNAKKLHVRYSRYKNAVLKRLNNYCGCIVNPSVNYLDFNHALRYREDISNIVFQSLQDLKSRKIVPWINIDSLWNNHIMRKKNLADALIVLASLEIHLKAGREI